MTAADDREGGCRDDLFAKLREDTMREADDRLRIGDWAIRSLREAIEAGKPITVAELEVLQAVAEARGFRNAIAALQDGERIAKWLGLKATGAASQRGAISYLRPAAEYLEAVEGDDRD